ncbi:phage tail protein [Chryseobacterium sp. SORGH_AS_1048]|uniref:phage tail protein n=1 Tax=Chryseobacterium sp. SORGH_AS_1048 TaxID=3041783 RepID=UPI002788AC74|nr:tail fiber protein [Chryseobacterium sp. SORGH_AS_1048]MDQ1099138.1 microcystin-dependent protein [Chryseobacterium sp. SORGH_AS_1048]
MEGYIGEIRLFGGNFAPLGWVFCDGTKYSLAEYTAAFTLLGTTFGGDGQTTFAVPDLRGRVAVGTGQGTGLTAINLGQTGGSETVTMTSAQMPLHSQCGSGNHYIPLFLR